jgi:hypothetical protein
MDIITPIYLLIATVFAVVFFRAAKTIGVRNRVTQRYLPVLNAAELVLWAIIVFGSVDLFLDDKTYYPYLVILLSMTFMLIIVWYYLKDIVAGFLFRVRHNPLLSQVLETRELQGTIRRVGLSQLTVELSDGKLLRVPYSTLVTQSLSLYGQHSMTAAETTVQIKVDHAVDPGLFRRMVRQSLALSSWCIVAKPISIVPEPDSEGTFRVSFFLLDPSYLPQAKDRLSTLAKNIDKRDSTKVNIPTK